MREMVILACNECRRRNYTTTKNSAVPRIDLSLRSIVVLVASILRTEKRGDITG